MENLATIDLIIIAIYFTGVACVAWWANKKRSDQSHGYFLADRDLGWLVVGTSLFASNIGSEHLIGLAGTGAASGLAVGHFEWLACLILLLLGWFFVPFYLRSGVTTMPEFLERRYNAACRWYFSFISIVGYVLTKISVSLYAGGLIIREITGLDFWYSATTIVIFTGIYTAVGGLRAVVYTDTMQAAVLLVGTLTLLYLGLDEVGGWTALQQKAPVGFFDMWKAIDDPSFPWTGIIFGAPILAVWYWCTDQVIVQRVLAARNEDQARKGTIFAGYLKILPLFIFIIPGVIASVLYEDVSAGSSDHALPVLVLRLLGPGMRGFFLAALLAALMGSLSATFNSCSTLITWDVYKKFRPHASEQHLVTVGRLSTILLVLLGILWIPFMQYVSPQLYIYLQSVQGYISPPIAACFLLGLLFPRLNGKGALATLAVGFLLGCIRLVLEIYHGVDRTGLAAGTFWRWYTEINFLHFAILLFAICCLVMVAVSLLTEPPLAVNVKGLTWAHRFEGFGKMSLAAAQVGEAPEVAVRNRKLGVLFSVLLVFILAALWTYFS